MELQRQQRAIWKRSEMGCRVKEAVVKQLSTRIPDTEHARGV